MNSKTSRMMRAARAGTLILAGLAGVFIAVAIPATDRATHSSGSSRGPQDATGCGKTATRRLELGRPSSARSAEARNPTAPGAPASAADPDPAAAFRPPVTNGLGDPDLPVDRPSGDPAAPFQSMVASGDVSSIGATLRASRDPGTIKAGLHALRELDPEAARETAVSLAAGSELEPSLRASLRGWAAEIGGPVPSQRPMK